VTEPRVVKVSGFPRDEAFMVSFACENCSSGRWSEERDRHVVGVCEKCGGSMLVRDCVRIVDFQEADG
jgi:hypothetical protein